MWGRRPMLAYSRSKLDWHAKCARVSPNICTFFYVVSFDRLGSSQLLITLTWLQWFIRIPGPKWQGTLNPLEATASRIEYTIVWYFNQISFKEKTLINGETFKVWISSPLLCGKLQVLYLILQALLNSVELGSRKCAETFVGHRFTMPVLCSLRS